MRIDRLASLLVARSPLRAGVTPPEASIAILMYHSVSDDREPGVPPYYRLATSPGRFREHMRCLADGGFTVIDLAEARRRLAGGWREDERAVVVTFDDGFRDFREQAWPVLAEFGYTATVFLPTDYIGDVRRSFKERECLTWDEVRELHEKGVSFGAHTVTHPELHRLAWPQVRREVRQSREVIEDRLRAPIDTFAYPYAFPQEDESFVAAFRRELSEAGYAAAVTTLVGRLSGSSDPLCLKRLPINECDDRRLFRGKLEGAYDWVGSVQRFKRSLRTERRTKS